MLRGEEVKQIRENLGMTQPQLAQLLGVHHLTVSKWERDLLHPNAHQASMLQSFNKATVKQDNIGEIALKLLVGAGVAWAVYELLKVALEPKEKKPGQDEIDES